MYDKPKRPLQVILHGMDKRTQKIMLMYFQGACKGAAVIVEELDAEVDIIDVDTLIGKEILKKLKSSVNLRPIIVLSKAPLKLENILYLKKPIRLVKILAIFNQVHQIIEKKDLKKNVSASHLEAEILITENKKPMIKAKEVKKFSKYKRVMHLNDTHFSAYIGLMTEINFNDDAQVLKAYYNPKDYYQGYVAAAFNRSKNQDRVIQLNSNWKSLLIFPHSHEIWLDIDDNQLRAIAALEMNKATGANLTITTANLELTRIKKKLKHFDDMDAFIWKLAIWTSRGRYPQVINIKRPIYLQHWPNFTRLLITPHALQIAALLVIEPKPMLNVAEVLNIKPQYVFVFVSAAYALGLIKQPIEKPTEVVVHPTLVLKEKQGLLNRVLNKLRN